MPSEVREITECRSCGSRDLEEVLDLGSHAVSDFLEEGESCEYAPLVLTRCSECTLVQLRHTVPRERLYRRYWYKSSTNESMVAALRDVVEDARANVDLKAGDSWVDIGANDGTLLSMVPEGVERVAFEPSNLAAEGAKHSNVLFNTFFPSPVVAPIRAKVITSIAMFYDLDDPNAFVAAIKKWLAPDGLWIVQMAELEGMAYSNAFDNVCHEHLEYYNSVSFQNLLHRHGLRMVSSRYNSVNGHSVRAHVMHAEACVHGLNHWFPAEPDMAAFAARTRTLRTQTRALLEDLADRGKLVMGYGASTKGNTLLQYYGVGPDLVRAIADRNPDKWGKKTVGSNIPIISESNMRECRPDYLLVLPWHFMESFRKREADFLAHGGKFIVPLPVLRVEGIDHADLPEKVFAAAARP